MIYSTRTPYGVLSSEEFNRYGFEGRSIIDLLNKLVYVSFKRVFQPPLLLKIFNISELKRPSFVLMSNKISTERISRTLKHLSAKPSR